MGGVRINTGMPRPEDPAASLPRERWRDLAIVRELWSKSQFAFDCRLLRQVAADAPLMAPELGYGSADEFMRQELGLDPDLMRRVLGEPSPRTAPTTAASRAKAERDKKRRQRGTDLSARPCAHCGAVFTPRRSTAQFCSSGCRVAAHRAKITPA